MKIRVQSTPALYRQSPLSKHEKSTVEKWTICGKVDWL